METINKIINKIKQEPVYLAILWINFVFIQSLFFKFDQLFGEANPATYVIFTTIGDWMQSLGLVGIGAAFAAYGAVAIGTAELITSALLWFEKTRRWAFAIALGIMSGAIFFHLFTPLGIFPYLNWDCRDVGCPQEKGLFIMAVLVWLVSAFYTFKNRKYLLCTIGIKI